MYGNALTGWADTEGNYLRRLLNVMGAKGIVVLLAFPLLFVFSVFDASMLAASGLLAAAFSYALIVDTESSSKELGSSSDIKLRTEDSLVERLDTVGAIFVVLALGYLVFLALGRGVTPLFAFVASLVLFAGVMGDYFITEGDDDDSVDFDVVGFAVGEVLFFYSVIIATGWWEFAHSPTFGFISGSLYMGTVAAFAGYAVFTREIVISRTDDEVHKTVWSILNELSYLEKERDEELINENISEEIRRVSQGLDGIRIPTVIQDDKGYIPVAVSKRKPDESLLFPDIEQTLRTADEEGLTGYAVQDDDFFLFRNGNLIKYYRDGKYGYDREELEAQRGVVDATFYSVSHSALNELDSITPSEEDPIAEEDEREVLLFGEKEDEKDEKSGEKKETQEGLLFGEEKTEEVEDEGESGDESKGTEIEIGGDEIDIDEMFEKAEEVMDDLE